MSGKKSIIDRLIETLSKIHNALFSGLCHTRINDNSKKTQEAASFLYALRKHSMRNKWANEIYFI